MRRVTINERDLICERLQFIKDKGGILPDGTDVATAWEGIENYALEDRAYLHAGFLILFDTGRPWWNNKLTFYEQFVLKVKPTAQPELVPDILENMARCLGCEAVVAGDALAGKMTPFYERAGWVHLGTTLTKEITNVRRQGG